MKILSLRFQNIHSLKGKFTIDFTTSPLSDTGIFAIIGPTGSGKSTILDAITLALFNRVPRTGNLSKNTVETVGAIMTKNTDECYTEVEYQVRDKRYRSKWSISRARTGNLRDYDMELASVNDNKFLDLKKSEVPKKNTEIIGLDYDQFLKSILLSQGEFAKFLKADAHERTDLLEKITGTEIYREIGKHAYLKKKEEDNKLEKLQTQFETIKLLDKQEVDDKEQKLKLTITQVRQYQIESERYNQWLQIMEKLFNEKKQLEILQQKKEKIIDDIKNFKPEIDKLHRHNSLISFQSDMLQTKQLENELIDIKNDRRKTIDKIEQLNTKKKENQAQLIEFQKKYEDSEKKYQSIRPLLAEVRKIDNQTEHLAKQIKKENSEIAKKNKELDNKTSDILELQKNITQARTEKEKTGNWLKQNLLLTELDDDFPLIKDKYQAFIAEKEKINNELSKQTHLVIKKLKKEPSWTKKAMLIQEEIEAIEANISGLQSTLDVTIEELPEIERKRENLREAYKAADKLNELSDFYTKQTQLLNENEAKKAENLKKKAKIEIELKKNEQELEILNKLLEELRIRKERQQLEAKYDSDRQKLEKDKPCFLCGSTEHPYIEHYENRLDETTKALREKEKEQKKLNKEINHLDKENVKTETEIQNFDTKINDSKNEANAVFIKFSECIKPFDWNEKIDDKESLKKRKSQIEKQGKKYAQQIEKLQKINKQKQESIQLQNLTEKVESIANLQTGIQKFSEKYTEYIPDSDDLKVVIEALAKQQKNYHSKTKKTEELEKKIYTEENIEREKQAMLKELKDSMEKQKGALKLLTEEKQTLVDERQKKLGKKSPDDVENEYREKSKKLSKAIAKIENQQTKISTEIDAAQNRLSEAKNRNEKANDSLAKMNEVLMPKLKNLGYDSHSVALQHILNEKEAEKIRNKNEELKKQQISVEQSITDRSLEMQRLNDMDLQWQEKLAQKLTLDELRQKLSSVSQKIEQANQQIGVLRTQLDDDKKRRVEAENLKRDMEKQKNEFNRWKNLSDLIGDATGKGFAKFAQELTLIQLLALANTHLKTLNDRYIIRKNEHDGGDDIIVIDMYQGNAKRSVKTLSGGESFLVSLALALGLSDLAGKNTKIESLFIDEGFGSLDQETLDIALNALEKMQMESNRSIGVISHVESLKERIRTHIELQKTTSGYSKIDIHTL